MSDVLAILKSDQMDRFGTGVEYVSKFDTAEAKAMQAQLEIAWGEAQFLVGDIMWKMSERMASRVRRMRQKAASGDLAEGRIDKLKTLTTATMHTRRTAEALTTVAAEHTARGAKLAMEVISSSPDDYVGYRVAADYHRLREDWPKVEEMLVKIEATNPKSNGLLFLKGVAAIRRDADTSKGAEFLKQALANDPEFTRARAHLLLSRSSLADTYSEYSKLKGSNPAHQIVVWAGPAIESAHDEWMQERKDRIIDETRPHPERLPQ